MSSSSMEMRSCCLIYLVMGVWMMGGVVVSMGVEVHHVVGDDRGWESSSDISSWSSKRLFRVGDNLWFAYSAAEEIVAELRSKEEYESCNVSNPIKMYTDGLNKLKLDQQGPRYFASGVADKCKNGLKLHIDVLPQGAKGNINQIDPITGLALAEPPSTPSPPSASPPPHLKGVTAAVPALLWVSFALLNHFRL